MTSVSNIASAVSSSASVPSYGGIGASCAVSAPVTSTIGSTSASISSASPTGVSIAPTSGTTTVIASSTCSYPVMSSINASSLSNSIPDNNLDLVNTFNASSNSSVDDGSATLTPGAALIMSNAVNVSNTSMTSNTSNIASATAVTSTASVPLVELRKACIHLLLSMLPLPLHFQV